MTSLLAGYRQLAATLARMVELARAKQWQQLPALDARCTTLFDQLQDMPSHEPSAAERARILALAGRIRADQDELTGLVRPQFERLMRTVEGQQQPVQGG